MALASEHGFRNLEAGDYDKGIIELLSELTTIDKSKISQNEFEKYVIANQNHHKTIVLECENSIVATGSILFERKLIHNLGTVGHIEDIVVKREYRGQDIGKALIDVLVQKAKRSGCYKVILDCNEKNTGFYEKCGFRRCGVEMRVDL